MSHTDIGTAPRCHHRRHQRCDKTIETSQLAHRDVTSRQRRDQRSFVDGTEVIIESRFQRLQQLPAHNIQQLDAVGHGHIVDGEFKFSESGIWRHERLLCKNGWMDPHAVWNSDSL